MGQSICDILHIHTYYHDIDGVGGRNNGKHKLPNDQNGVFQSGALYNGRHQYNGQVQFCFRQKGNFTDMVR